MWYWFGLVGGVLRSSGWCAGWSLAGRISFPKLILCLYVQFNSVNFNPPPKARHFRLFNPKIALAYFSNGWTQRLSLSLSRLQSNIQASKQSDSTLEYTPPSYVTGLWTGSSKWFWSSIPPKAQWHVSISYLISYSSAHSRPIQHCPAIKTVTFCLSTAVRHPFCHRIRQRTTLLTLLKIDSHLTGHIIILLSFNPLNETLIKDWTYGWRQT